MTQRKHRHHIVPRHMGGTDDEENLTPPISIQLHAEFHKQLYSEFGKTEDLIAWKALSGRITSEEACTAHSDSLRGNTGPKGVIVHAGCFKVDDLGEPV